MPSDPDRPTEIRLGIPIETAHQRAAWTRREFMRRTSLALLATPALAAACGGSSSSSSQASSGTQTSEAGKTINMINYQGWMGTNEVQNFTKDTGIHINQVYITSDPGRVTKIATDQSAIDLTLADLTSGGELQNAHLLDTLNWANIPNYANVPAHYKVYLFSEANANGGVSDFGRTGFVYRTDMVKEPINSWHDIWKVAPKYSGKIVFLDSITDTYSSALLSLGYPVNSTNSSQVTAARDALIKIKPDLAALVQGNALQPLLNGSAAIAMDWDFDAASVIPKHPNVPLKWVNAQDGMYAYLEGWAPVKGTQVLPEIEKFINNHLDPKVYGGFVNTLSIANMMPNATKYISKDIQNNPILSFGPDVEKLITFGNALGLAEKQREQGWADFKSA
jgi:spermidine/putrescine transport system substrate-binding protein